MNWSFKNDKPIYLQIIDQIKRGILSGTYPPGAVMPSVRDLATEAEVNPNTMQKALSELESEQLLFSVRTSGRFVTKDEKMIIDLKASLSKDLIRTFLMNMRDLGLNDEETLLLMKREVKEVANSERNNGMQ